jgi:hypothetical protein
MWHHRKGFLAWTLVLSLLILPQQSFAQANSVTAIDLVTDLDQDGLPDALVKEVYQIHEQVANGMFGQFTTTDGISAASEVAAPTSFTQTLDQLVARLPYSPQTRQALAQSQPLQQRLLNASSQEEYAALAEELHALNQVMMTDSAYATTIRTLDVLFNEREIQRPRLNNTLFIPVLTTTAGTSQATLVEEEQSRMRATMASTDINPDAVVNGPRWNWLWAGDTLFIRGGGWSSVPNRILYCSKYCHAGTYNGNNLVFESNPGKGVRLLPLIAWKARGAYVGIGWNDYVSNLRERQALNWAKNKWGAEKNSHRTNYNYMFTDKWTDARLYCSQLVWKQHQWLGYNVDSNNWAYLMSMYSRWGYAGFAIAWSGVMPDEVALSSVMYIYTQGYNP